MAEDHDLMTDAELCDKLRISSTTLRTHLREGPPRRRHQNSGDIRLIEHFYVGGIRRWKRQSVINFMQGKDSV